jgi:hypothetical protein
MVILLGRFSYLFQKTFGMMVKKETIGAHIMAQIMMVMVLEIHLMSFTRITPTTFHLCNQQKCQ